ncbi:MAG: HU family DNA-binding protein [Bacteroidales bacterium]|nr:HU family DNA-binding protein [Bacteroidales bacterium]MBP5413189.1 HU family DNA-binding protein [Bacteroidales bacterium]
MNKSQLVDAMAAETGLTKKQSKQAVDSFVKLVTVALKKDKKFTVPGFMTMNVVKRSARTARNISTGATIKVPAKNVVKVKVGATLAGNIK